MGLIILCFKAIFLNLGVLGSVGFPFPNFGSLRFLDLNLPIAKMVRLTNPNQHREKGDRRPSADINSVRYRFVFRV